jgi:hypothetical protein
MSMKINGYSYLLLVIPEQPTDSFDETEVQFHIVNNTSEYNDPTPYSRSTKQIVASGENATLKFAANNFFGSEFHQPDPDTTGVLQGSTAHRNDPGTENLVTTFLVLYWEYGDTGEVLGQTIPFVSIHLPWYKG